MFYLPLRVGLIHNIFENGECLDEFLFQTVVIFFFYQEVVCPPWAPNAV